MNNYSKGFSMIEFTIALFIAAIIVVPLINILHLNLRSWKTTQTSLELSNSAHLTLTPIIEKLTYIQAINDVSLSSSQSAYITYTNYNDDQFTIFYNSENNQNLFNKTNRFGAEHQISLSKTNNFKPKKTVKQKKQYLGTIEEEPA